MITWQTCDVFDGLATLDDGSIDLVVTSPPFLALRSYLPADHPDKDKEIGSEATPAEFLDVMLKVTAELRRVLAPYGSIAIELGDTYAGSGGAGGDYDPGGWRDGQMKWARTRGEGMQHPINHVSGTPGSSGGEGWPLAKSKTLIPELYRIALAYGFNPLTGEPSPAGRWRVRNVVTWCRPNPPVGALGDKWRPATSDIVVACVSGKRYWDDLATRRPYTSGTLERGISTRPDNNKTNADERGGGWSTLGPIDLRDGPGSGAPLLDYWEIPLLDDEEPRQYGPKEKPPRVSPGGSMHDHSMDEVSGLGAKGRRFRGGEWVNEAGAPLLDYWEIPPTGYAGAHYAVYPPALVEPLVKAMVPERVCRTCGEPSRRIVKQEPHNGERTALANHIRQQREAKGLTQKQVAAYFPSVTGGMTGCVWNWENDANVPTAEQWPILVDLLDLSDEFAHLIEGTRQWTESLVEYEHVNDHPSGTTQDATGRVYNRLPARKNRIEPDAGWTDCGHDDWRPGVVLDPFAGSGTTLAVASGHGHDAIGFDLDPRNEELARERVGPLLWQEA